ncbi:MAG: phosphatase PAP2 family protein [bacterium]
MKNFIYSIPRNIINCFRGRNLIWHFVAIFLTFVFVQRNFDWYYFIYTRNNILIYSFFPAVIFGGILPILVPAFIIVYGHIKKRKDIWNIGWLLVQAVILGAIISSFYKFFTGRAHPGMYDVLNNISSKFDFGFAQNGIFWGWPSSHTTIAFAMVLTLIGLFPRNKKVKYLSLIYAFYVGIGVSLTIHWLSDFIAGAIFGSIIGITIIKNYKKNQIN